MNSSVVKLATRVYRRYFPYILAWGSIPEYLIKYRRYEALDLVKEGFSDHRKWKFSETPETVGLVKRLISAYMKAKEDQATVEKQYKPGFLWQEIIETRFSPLVKACCEGNITGVQDILDNFNREPCGDDTCGGGQYYQRMRDIPGYKYQFINAWYKRYEACKEYLGYRPNLSVPPIGNPVGLSFTMGETIPLCHLEYYSYASAIRCLIGKITSPTVCEIGGGVGGQAYELIRHNIPGLVYIIMDLPEVLLLSSYFLMRAFPGKEFQLYGETYSGQELRLLPNFCLPELANHSVNLFFNSCSFSEMDYDTTREYIAQIERVCRDYLMHINHTARLNWGKVYNMIADEVNPYGFNLVYKRPRMFSLLEDTFVIHWFYRARYYEYLHKKVKK